MKKFYPLLLLLTCLSQVFAQQKGPGVRLANLLKLQDSLHLKLPVEKTYIQLDKPYYNLGDTIRFKCYLFNSDFLTRSERSGVLYLELDGANGKATKRIMVPVASGLSWGDIPLDETEVRQGSYTLRAYTNWMRNFGEDYIFKKDIYIFRASDTSILIKADFKPVKEGDKDRVAASLRFTDLNKRVLALRDMQLRVMNGTHTISKVKATTGIDGTLALNFDLADKTTVQNLLIQAQQTGKNADTAILTIPVTINRVENTDLQFMPEGGNMVAGLQTKIGFKAIGEDGKGVDVSGKIYNSKQEEVASFSSLHKGMGSFSMTPAGGEVYTAKITLDGGIKKTYALPPVKNSGTVMNVSEQAPKVYAPRDSIFVKIAVTPDLQNSTFYLMGNLREAFYASTIRFQHQTTKTIAIAKSLFPSGIIHFTLLNQQGQPLNERIAYIDHSNDLNITINSSPKTYAARDSIALNICVTNKTGQPVQGSFSLAVTDDGQVKTDSLGSNMVNYLLLTSDLKGTIEDPGYYKTNLPQRATELDNLLLTQGWVGYDWKQAPTVKGQPVQYAAESGYSVSGRVFNGFNRPVENSRISLMSTKPFFATDTVTGKDGKFVFKDLFPGDSSAFVIQAKRKNGSANVNIEAEEFKPPVFTRSEYQLLPWYVNSDTLLLRSAGSKISQQKANEKLQFGSRMLKDVNIKEKLFIPDSHNLNGSGKADYVFDEKDMEKEHKKSLLEVLQEKFKDFKVRAGFYGDTYFLNMHYVVLVIDGAFIGRFNLSPNIFMDGLYADQIKGIEVMYTSNYAISYNPKFLQIKATAKYEEQVPVYIEVTTFAGQGAFINKTPNLLVYRPMPFALPTKFYSPKYRAKRIAANSVPDLRSTIHWEPNIITDKNGKATISFYTSDQPGNYTVIIEGSDMNGNIGSVVKKLVNSKSTP